MRILMINILSSENRGDLALIESGIQQLQAILGDVDISISAVFPETIKKSIPDVTVISELIDLPTVYADKKAGNRKSWRMKFFMGIYTIIMFYQIFFALFSWMITKIGLKPIYRSQVINAFKNADLIIFNGGEALKEGSAFLSEYSFSKQKFAWWVVLFHSFISLFFSKKVFRKPLVVFPNTVGPVRTFIGYHLIKASIKCVDLFMVRDDISNLLLNKMRLSNFIRTNDIALLLKNDSEGKRLFSLNHHTIGVSPGLFDLNSNPALKHRYIESHSKVLDYLIENQGFNIVFLP